MSDKSYIVNTVNDLVMICHHASANAGWWKDPTYGNLIDEVRDRTRFGLALIAEKLYLAHTLKYAKLPKGRAKTATTISCRITK